MADDAGGRPQALDLKRSNKLTAKEEEEDADVDADDQQAGQEEQAQKGEQPQIEARAWRRR